MIFVVALIMIVGIVALSRVAGRRGLQREAPPRASVNSSTRWVSNGDRESDEHRIFLEYQRPDGFVPLASNVHVAGISHYPMAERFVNGSDHRLGLQREPNNPHSEHGNAIMVLAYWSDRAGQQSAHIGYVPHETSAKIAEKWKDRNLIAFPRILFPPHGSHKSPGIRFDILRDKVVKAEAKKRKPKVEDSNISA